MANLPLSSLPFRGAACDSRHLLPGQLFVALKGGRSDGHDFLAEVAARGAAAALVDENYCGPSYGIPLIYATNTLRALQELAASRLARSRCRVIAVTGSVGKTTIKEFLTVLIGSRFRTASTPHNANSQVGLPLAILNGLHGDEEFFICEMGMSHPGELKRLVSIAPPHLALVANVSLAHAENFPSLYAIAEAKAEIFSHPNTFCLFNSSLPNGAALKSALAGRCHSFSFEKDSDAEFYLRASAASLAIERGERSPVTSFPPLSLPGLHNGENFLLAAFAASLCGLPFDAIAAAQPSLTLPERRLQYCEKNGALFINDSYNACLTSIKAALEAMPLPQIGGKRFAIIGEILELGSFSEQCHRIVGELALRFSDYLFCLGEGCLPAVEVWQCAQRPCRLFRDRSSLVQEMKTKVTPGDVVLVKGSRAKEMWKVIEEM